MKTETIVLGEREISSFKKFIDNELRVRGINVTTTLEQDGSSFKLSSTKFNTFPVIHSEIEIVDFGSSINHATDELGLNAEIITLWLRVYAKYKGNGATLFTTQAKVYRSKDWSYVGELIARNEFDCYSND